MANPSGDSTQTRILDQNWSLTRTNSKIQNNKPLNLIAVTGDVQVVTSKKRARVDVLLDVGSSSSWSPNRNSSPVAADPPLALTERTLGGYGRWQAPLRAYLSLCMRAFDPPAADIWMQPLVRRSALWGPP